MRMLTMMAGVFALGLVATSVTAAAADSGEVDPDARTALAAFHRAFPGDDATAKRQALNALADPKVGDDDEILPLLVAAVDDRQAADAAIAALRNRTGLQPPSFMGQSHYPGYPPNDAPASWQYWLTDRERAKVQDESVDRALTDAREAKAAADEAAASVK